MVLYLLRMRERAAQLFADPVTGLQQALGVEDLSPTWLQQYTAPTSADGIKPVTEEHWAGSELGAGLSLLLGVKVREAGHA